MSEELKARIAELESWYAASQESQRELLKRIALADRLAEAALEALRFVGDIDCFGYKCRLPQCSDCNYDVEPSYPAEAELKSAIAAYRSPETGLNQA